jgi:small GTP-binding protein
MTRRWKFENRIEIGETKEDEEDDQKYLSKRFISTKTTTKNSLSSIQNRNHYKKFRIYLLGASSSGKTTFMRRITKNSIPSHDIPTIGVDYSQIHLDNYEISLELYEFGGNPHFSDIYTPYFRTMYDLAILFVDTSRRETIEDFMMWKSELVRENPYEDLNERIIVVGTKCELRNEITIHDMNLFKKYPYYKISAKKKRGIRRLVNDIEHRALDRYYQGQIRPARSEFAERFRSTKLTSKQNPPSSKQASRKRRSWFRTLMGCSCCVPSREEIPTNN